MYWRRQPSVFPRSILRRNDMRFTKMHGLGNDYLYVFGEAPQNASKLSILLSERHMGAGADGMIWISPSDIADFKMRIFNADGSEAKMCGNGIRCVGKYLYDKGYTQKANLTIETLSGLRTLTLHRDGEKVTSVSVNMGKATANERMTLQVEDTTVSCIPVSVGNPHIVLFVEDITAIPLTSLGPKLEKHEVFEDGVNVEFVEVLTEQELRMRVWERGSGVTMACGTGACASAMAAISCGFCKYDAPMIVHLDGGDLTIQISADNTVTMTGPAEFVYEGDTEICLHRT